MDTEKLIAEQNKANQQRRTKDLVKFWKIQNESVKLWSNYGVFV